MCSNEIRMDSESEDVREERRERSEGEEADEAVSGGTSGGTKECVVESGSV